MTDTEFIAVLVVFAAVLAASGLGYGAGRWHRAHIVRRLSRTVETLAGQLDDTEDDLAAERELVARLSKPAAALLADVRGAHHKTEGADRG